MPLRVIHVTENLDYSFGGPPRSVPYLAKHLEDLGVHNYLFSVKLFDKESNEVIDKYGLRWSSAPFAISRHLRFAPGLRHLILAELRNNKNTVLHSHNMWNFAPYLVFRLHREFGVPYVMSVRGTLFDWSLNQSKWKKALAMKIFQRAMLDRCAFIHATSHAELQAIRALGIATPVVVVPNGVATEEFEAGPSRTVACESLGLNPQRRYMLFLSRIDRKKGLDLLIPAWSALSRTFKDWHLVIAGPLDNSTYSQNIRKTIQSSVDSGIATYFGPLDGSRRLAAYSAADLFVLPTHTENFGIVIAEALASGTPVITTKGAPWSEIAEYRAGWWIDDPGGIEMALTIALGKSAQELAEMGRNGRALVEKNYNWRAVAQRMKASYQWALGERSLHPPIIY